MNSLPLNRQRLGSANDPRQRHTQGNNKWFLNAFSPTCTHRCIDTPSTSGTYSGYTGDVDTESGTDSYVTPDVSWEVAEAVIGTSMDNLLIPPHGTDGADFSIWIDFTDRGRY